MTKTETHTLVDADRDQELAETAMAFNYFDPTAENYASTAEGLNQELERLGYQPTFTKHFSEMNPIELIVWKSKTKPFFDGPEL